MSTTATRTDQVVRGDEAYSARDFRRRTGLTDFSYRSARRAGLRVIRFRRKVYVRGSDWLSFLERIASGEISLGEEAES
jgi:hypothetical protein